MLFFAICKDELRIRKSYSHLYEFVTINIWRNRFSRSRRIHRIAKLSLGINNSLPQITPSDWFHGIRCTNFFKHVRVLYINHLLVSLIECITLIHIIVKYYPKAHTSNYLIQTIELLLRQKSKNINIQLPSCFEVLFDKP